MSEVSKKVTTVEVKDEFRVCPSCQYQRGFHVSFQPEGKGKSLRLILICPNCGARYEINNRYSTIV